MAAGPCECVDAPAMASLPPELLSHIVGELSGDSQAAESGSDFSAVSSLLALSRVSRVLHAAAGSKSTWHSLITRRHRAVLRVLFDGVVPEPRAGLTWKQHYYEFSSSWKQLAMERTPSRLLLAIRSDELAPKARRSRRGVSTLGVYDVTLYAWEHPGAEMLLMEAADEPDATDLFRLTEHSDHARRVLRSLAVPGLRGLPIDHEHESLRRSRRRSRWRQDAIQKVLLQSGLSDHRLWATLVLCFALVSLLAEYTDTAVLGPQAHASLIAMCHALLHPPHFVSLFILVAALGGWPWQSCVALSVAVLSVALRAGAVEPLAEFFGALCKCPGWPCAMAVTVAARSMSMSRRVGPKE